MTKKHLTIQEHDADRAGLHWDLRIGNEKIGLLSWVIPKAQLPETAMLLAIKVETHAWDYRNFEGEIKSGYGKGTVKLIYSGETEVFKFTDKKVSFAYDGERYSMFAGKGNKWFIKRKD